MDIFQKSITPDKPRVLAEEQIYVYVPMATSTNAGIASYNRDQFDIIGSEVSLKWPAKSFVQGPIETPSIVKVLDNEFEYTGNIVDLISGNSKISSDKLEVQLKRILRDAYERPELVMLDPNYFVRTIVEKDGKQYYKYNTTAVHYNMSQTLSEDEQTQARQNISASSVLDNEATNKRIDALLQTGVYTVNGKTGNVVLKNSDIENDTNYATNERINTIEINITNLDNKQNLDVITDISITGTGDNRYITSTTKNIKTQVVSTDNDQLTLASDTRAGLMSVSDYQQLRANTSKIEQLENKTSRLIYNDKSNPTASDINNFAVGEGYEPPFAGLSVVVADTYHIWHYYANIGWKDDGLDIVQQFTNTTSGVIMGSELDGKIYAETDGTASVNGWGALKGLVSSIDINMTNHINNTQNPHNVTKTQVGLSNVDNTSDIDKPISTAVQSALDLMLPRSEAPTKVSDLENDAAYIKNNDLHSSVQIPYIYNVHQIYSVEDKDHLYGNSDGKTNIDLSSGHVSINREYPNTPTYISVFASERDGVRDVTSIQSASTKRLIIDGVEEPTFPSNSGGLYVISEDDGSYIKADLSKLTVVQNEDGSNTLQQDSKSLIFNWNGLYLNNNEISPNAIRYDIEQTLTDEQKAQARANIGAGTGGGTDNYQELYNKPIMNTTSTETLSPNASETINGTINLHKISKTGALADTIQDSTHRTVTDTEKTTWNNKSNFDGSFTSLTNVPTASEGVSGVIQIATDQEAGNGTNTSKAVNPKQLQSAIQGLGTVFDLKGTKATVQDLPSSGNEIGDVWYVTAEQVGYIWLNDGTTDKWEQFGAPIDLSGYVQYVDIINNLTSTATNKALSAYQGKILNDQMSSLSSQLSSTNSNVSTLQSKVSTLENDNSTNKSNISTLQTQMANQPTFSLDGTTLTITLPQ